MSTQPAVDASSASPAIASGSQAAGHGQANKMAAPAPRAIAPLPASVVSLIAAGEIIQRPSNALKELIENCLDAGSTSIRVTVKEGGLKLLQIQDNGSGIRKADLPILCERFTTSKIKAFEDLSQLGTYGFRGEALASISHVAHLSVTTKTRDESCAWKAAYSNGDMVPVKVGLKDSQPIPCAGNDGTLIVVEDLFYNTPTRLKSLRSTSDEYSRIVAVVLHYSIHNAGVSMVCKKANASTADVNTAVGASVNSNIGLHYGEAVRKELVEVVVENAELGVKAEGWFSGANYGAKKGTYLFFINHRLVDCTPLKRAFEGFYGTLLAKGAYPFVYLSLEINPTKVDVNVHPTKREVGFEDQDEIVELICDALAKKLEKASESRSFKVQTLLPGARPVDETPKPSRTKSDSSTPKPSTSGSSTRKAPPKSFVRTDHNTQTLDSMFVPVVDSDRPSKRRKTANGAEVEPSQLVENQQAVRVKIPQSDTVLTSIKELRAEVIERNDEGLEAIVKNHVFVGVADLQGSLSMLQHHQKLLLVNHASLSEELFYQLGLRQFGRFVRIKLSPPPPLRDLIRLAVEHEEGKEAAKMSTEEIIERVHSLLVDQRAMLEEYFSLSITEDGKLESLPLIVPGYTPNLSKLPLFLIRIGIQVDWTAEKPCFESFIRELAFFYVPGPAPFADDMELPKEQEANEKRQIQHVVFPAAKQYLLPPTRLLKKDVVQVTSLESLYKVFERC